MESKVIAEESSLQRSKDEEKILLIDELINTIVEITSLKDVETFKHIENVSKIVKLIITDIIEKSPELIDETTRKYIEYLGIELFSDIFKLHDIGKLGVDSSLLLSPKRLPPTEFMVMKNHVGIGTSMINNRIQRIKEKKLNGIINSFFSVCLLAVSQHHERWDGEGYPLKLSGENISLTGRLCAVADNIDALISDRPYKKPWSKEEVILYLLENSEIVFDKRLIKTVENNWNEIINIYEK